MHLDTPDKSVYAALGASAFAPVHVFAQWSDLIYDRPVITNFSKPGSHVALTTVGAQLLVPAPPLGVYRKITSLRAINTDTDTAPLDILLRDGGVTAWSQRILLRPHVMLPLPTDKAPWSLDPCARVRLAGFDVALPPSPPSPPPPPGPPPPPPPPPPFPAELCPACDYASPDELYARVENFVEIGCSHCASLNGDFILTRMDPPFSCMWTFGGTPGLYEYDNCGTLHGQMTLRLAYSSYWHWDGPDWVLYRGIWSVRIYDANGTFAASSNPPLTPLSPTIPPTGACPLAAPIVFTFVSPYGSHDTACDGSAATVTIYGTPPPGFSP